MEEWHSLKKVSVLPIETTDHTATEHLQSFSGSGHLIAVQNVPLLHTSTQRPGMSLHDQAFGTANNKRWVKMSWYKGTSHLILRPWMNYKSGFVLQEYILSQDSVGSMTPDQWADFVFEQSRLIEPKDLPIKKAVSCPPGVAC